MATKNYHGLQEQVRMWLEKEAKSACDNVLERVGELRKRLAGPKILDVVEMSPERIPPGILAGLT